MRLSPQHHAVIAELATQHGRDPQELLDHIVQAFLDRQAKDQASLERRFWAKVDKSGEHWLWTAARHRAGHGMVGRRAPQSPYRLVGVQSVAHRVAYELVVGPIPPGLIVRHLCGIAACVRPDHLALGSQQDNIDDRTRHGTTAQGERSGTAKLKAAQVVEIRRLRSEGHTLQSIADRYGVVFSTIFRITSGRGWKSIPAGQ